MSHLISRINLKYLRKLEFNDIFKINEIKTKNYLNNYCKN